MQKDLNVTQSNGAAAWQEDFTTTSTLSPGMATMVSHLLGNRTGHLKRS